MRNRASSTTVVACWASCRRWFRRELSTPLPQVKPVELAAQIRVRARGRHASNGSSCLSAAFGVRSVSRFFGSDLESHPLVSSIVAWSAAACEAASGWSPVHWTLDLVYPAASRYRATPGSLDPGCDHAEQEVASAPATPPGSPLEERESWAALSNEPGCWSRIRPWSGSESESPPRCF